MKKAYLFSILFYIPTLVFLILLSGFEQISTSMIIVSILLIFVGILYTINNWYINIIGFILLLFITIYSIYTENREHIKFGIINIIIIEDVYFVLIYSLKRILFRRKILLLEEESIK